MLATRIENLRDRTIIIILLGSAVGASLLSLVVDIIRDPNPIVWMQNWLENFSTEMFGAFLTFVLIEVIFHSRQQREAEDRATRELKERLVREMGSTDNGFAWRAVRELAAKKWLYDGTARGASLWRANLQDVYLTNADLQGADLNRANLRGAKLTKANLCGARLLDADLLEVRLDGAQFDEETVLPDGENWTPETDWGRFIDRMHPQFWRSANRKSPAYGRQKQG